MPFTLDQVVPWGRSCDEYVAMFGLTEADRPRRILGCGDGPAAFNAEWTRRGGRVVSADPVYAFTPWELEERIAATCDTVMAQVRQHQDDFVWESISSPDTLQQLRLSAMRRFLEDFAAGQAQGRYVVGELPALPFEDRAFDLALCSHFLFLYSAQLSLEFHLQAVSELLRVADEVRIFPLLALDGRRSPHLQAVMAALEARGLGVELCRVPYEFQRGADEMLRIHRA